MRDCDRDFVCTAVAGKDAGVRSPADIGGKVVATASQAFGRAAPTAGLGHGRRGFSTSAGHVKKVGVVGGGVAGLQAVRALRAKGFEVTAFERAPTVGGLWRGNYMNFGIQAPKQLFEVPDFPSKDKWGSYSTGPQVQQYIEEFTDHFGLRDAIATNTDVEAVVPNGDGWTFTVKEKGGAARDEHFDYCVVCTGMYSMDNKFIPDVPDKAAFQGEVLHSVDFRSTTQVEGKKVLVVGGGKSAIDCAVEASNVPGTKVTLLSRQPHWPTPRKIADLINFQYIFLSRFGQALVVGHRGPLPGTNVPLMETWHKVGWPVMAVVFRVVELLFGAQFRNVSGASSPLGKVGVVDDFYGFAHVLDYSFRDATRSGKLEWKQGAIEKYTADGVEVNGETVPADVVIFGTGFNKDYSIFPEATRDALGVESDGLYLYRHTLPLRVPNLAFVGSELATISNISSFGLQAEWLARHLSGSMALPSAAAMAEEVEATKTWKRRWMPCTPSRASLVLLHQTHFHDRLLKDMGISHRRKGANVLAELLMPYNGGAEYSGIIGTAA